MPPRLSGKLALITGASRGIGRSIALAFARDGARLILLARTKGALEEVDDEARKLGAPQPTLIQLDLAKGDKVDHLGPSLYERFGKLDILIANAGILGTLSPLPHVTDADWAKVMEINVTANLRLIRTLDPLLRRSDAGRAVFLSSAAAYKAKPFWGPYSVSKAALEALAKTWAHELENTAVRVNCLDPHTVRTGMRSKAMPGEDPMTVAEASALDEVVLDLVRPDLTANGEVFRAIEHPLYRPLNQPQATAKS